MNRLAFAIGFGLVFGGALIIDALSSGGNWNAATVYATLAGVWLAMGGTLLGMYTAKGGESA